MDRKEETTLRLHVKERNSLATRKFRERRVNKEIADVRHSRVDQNDIVEGRYIPDKKRSQGKS